MEAQAVYGSRKQAQRIASMANLLQDRNYLYLISGGLLISGLLVMVLLGHFSSADFFSEDPAFSVTAFILILVVALVYLLLTLQTLSAPRVRASPAVMGALVPGGQDIFDDVHPVEDVEGISPMHARRLNDMGIINTRQLWDADAMRVSRFIGASPNAVRAWQQMAELIAVKGIGPKYADLLQRAGVGSIKELSLADPKKLLIKVRKVHSSIHINAKLNPPGEALIIRWIQAARNHLPRRV